METKIRPSKGLLYTSYILQGLVVAMFLMGAVNNLLQTEMAVEGAVEMGYPRSAILYLGVILLTGTVLYVIPKTTILGAAVLTAWLGGAVATHIIHGDPILNMFFPVLFGILVWLSIWLRDYRLRALFPLKN